MLVTLPGLKTKYNKNLVHDNNNTLKNLATYLDVANFILMFCFNLILFCLLIN